MGSSALLSCEELSRVPVKVSGPWGGTRRRFTASALTVAECHPGDVFPEGRACAFGSAAIAASAGSAGVAGPPPSPSPSPSLQLDKAVFEVSSARASILPLPSSRRLHRVPASVVPRSQGVCAWGEPSAAGPTPLNAEISATGQHAPPVGPRPDPAVGQFWRCLCANAIFE